MSFALYWVFAAVLAWVVFPGLNLFYRRQSWARRTHRCQRIASGGFLVLLHFMRWLRLFDFDPRRARWRAPDEAFVLVANHPTLVDVVMLWALQRKLCCIVKPSLFRNPILGPISRYCGFIESGTGMAGAAVIRAAVDRLEAGFPVLIFPEGTRSPMGELGKFSRGAFEVAARANKPILPVWIHCNPPTLCRKMAWYALPKKTVTLRCTPLSSGHMDRWGRDTRAACNYYRELYADRLAGEAIQVAPTAPRRGIHEPRSA